MGIDAVLETEDRRVVASVPDPQSLFTATASVFERQFVSLPAVIDPYGDTTFNHLQRYEFLSEWQRLYPKCQVAKETRHLGQVEDLANQLTQHTYLRFVGD
jgi:hypothetical protein